MTTVKRALHFAGSPSRCVVVLGQVHIRGSLLWIGIDPLSESFDLAEQGLGLEIAKFPPDGFVGILAVA